MNTGGERGANNWGDPCGDAWWVWCVVWGEVELQSFPGSGLEDLQIDPRSTTQFQYIVSRGMYSLLNSNKLYPYSLGGGDHQKCNLHFSGGGA